MSSPTSTVDRQRASRVRERPEPSARVLAGRARAGRIALTLVVLLLAWSAVSPALDWVQARSDAAAQSARLQQLQATNDALRKQQAYLRSERGVVMEARVLNMVREGERTYQVRGLPKD